MANEEKKSYEEVLGINLDVSSVISGEIVKRFMAQITPEQMQNIIDDISKDCFNKKYDGRLEIKMKDNSSYSYTTTLGEQVKKQFDAQVKNDLMDECLKIIDTKDYKDKIKSWAEEIVDYIVEGYKNDIKQGLYNKLVGSVIDPASIQMSHMNAYDLRALIHSEISDVLKGR